MIDEDGPPATGGRSFEVQMAIYENIAAYYDGIFVHTDQKTDFIIGGFGGFTAKGNDARHLDLGCGTGELVLDLASRGVSAIGLDSEAQMIDWARRKASERDLNPAPEFIVGDIRACGEQFGADANDAGRRFVTGAAGPFDGVSCLGNTLVHLAAEPEIAAFFSSVIKLLAPTGTMSVQIVNYKRIFEHQVRSLPPIENEQLLFERYYDYGGDQAVVSFRTALTIKESGERFEQSSCLYPLLPERLISLVEAAGFTVSGLFENFASSPFDRESMSLLLRARPL